jgi:hypothetical protein
MSIDLVRRMACEALGTAFLLAIVIAPASWGIASRLVSLLPRSGCS